MPFPLQRVLDPLIEPVSLVDMKNYLRVDIDDDDSLIQTLISTARERAEDMTGRCLLRQSWVFSFDRFPIWEYNNFGAYGGQGLFHHHHRQSMFRHDHLAIILPRGPVLSVDSIQYKDLSGTLQTLDPATYEVDLLSQPARITPVYCGWWPFALWDTNSVTIRFTCGYEQTVTETLTLPAMAPFTVAVSRPLTALSLTSAVDATSLATVSSTINNGLVTVPTGTAGQKITVVYQNSNVPQSFIHAIKLIGSTYYENRAEVVQGGGNFNSFPTPLGANSLLSTYNMFPVGYPKG